MKWQELDLGKLIDIVPGDTPDEKLINAFDIKYGDLDYVDDLRSLTGDKVKKIISTEIKMLRNESNILDVIIAGANNGIEVPYFSGHHIIAIDLSGRALKHLGIKYPFVSTSVMNVSNLSFPDNNFDIYCSLRVIQSYRVDIEQAINESIRVTKDGGTCIYSIPNGYIIDGKVKKGMFDPSRNKYNKELPLQIAEQIVGIVKKGKMKYEIIEVESEILIIVNVVK